MSKKHAFIIHGWDGFPEEGWFPWLKAELEKQEYSVQIPAMPDAAHPAIDAWVGKLTKLIQDTKEDEIVLIGHSVGCQTILRTLEQMNGVGVSKVILVAPWFTLMNLSSDEKTIIEPWITTPIDFQNVRSKADSFTAILSDTDEWVPLAESKNILESELGAKVVIEHSKGHFSGGDGITELPSVLEATS